MAELDPRTKLLTGHTNQPDIVTNDGVWSVKVDATAGPFKLVVDGTATADIAADTAVAQDVEDALVATGEVEADQVSVTGGPANAGGTTPFVVTISDVEGQGVPTLAAGAETLTGGAGTLTVTQTQAPTVQAAHQTEVITDPTAPEAVQTPIAQQTGTVGNAGADDPSTVLGLND